MNKSGTESRVFRRVFLLEDLPDPLKPADDHWQIFDNYLKGTNLRLRSLRKPATNERIRRIEKLVPSTPFSEGVWTVQQIVLSEQEYAEFRLFKGREIRKNRYFQMMDGVLFEIDIYLGDLWGLVSAGVEFESAEGSREFEVPRFSLLEITGNGSFHGRDLVDRNFEDVKKEFEKEKSKG